MQLVIDNVWSAATRSGRQGVGESAGQLRRVHVFVQLHRTGKVSCAVVPVPVRTHAADAVTSGAPRYVVWLQTAAVGNEDDEARSRVTHLVLDELPRTVESHLESCRHGDAEYDRRQTDAQEAAS